MSDNSEQKPGSSGAAKVIGVGALAGSVYAADNITRNRGIKDALAGKEGAPKKIAEKVSSGLNANNGALNQVNENLKTAKTALGDNAALKVDSLGFAKSGDKAHTMFMNSNGSRGLELNMKNLPKGAEVGKTITDQKTIQTTLKDGIAKNEAALVKDVRKAGNFKFGSGLTGTSGKYKLIAGAGIIAATGIAYNIGKKMFPSHEARLQRERQVQQDLGRA